LKTCRTVFLAVLLTFPLLIDNTCAETIENISSATEIRQYIEVTGNSKKIFQWTLDNSEDWILTSQDKQEVHRTWLARDLSTKRWHLKRLSEDTETWAWRDSNILYIEGTLNGKRFDRFHPLDDRPWYQALSISLQKLIEGSKDNLSFWILHPGNLDLHSMQVSKIEKLSLEFYEHQIPAWQVEIRLTGWKAYLWHANYWFSVDDGRFLKYEAVSGPPGSPVTKIMLSEAYLSTN
jgi:hypothetical protein